MAHQVKYLVGVLDCNGWQRPCPNCYIQRTYPCTGCQYALDTAADPALHGWRTAEKACHVQTLEITDLQMEKAWPNLDFSCLQAGDRVVGMTETGPCPNCYAYTFPCLNCANHELNDCDCSHCQKKGKQWCTQSRLVHYDTIKTEGLAFPDRYCDYHQQSFDEHQRLLLEARPQTP